MANDSDRELARDNFGLLPWTSAADRVCLSANAAKMPGAFDAGI
jgi:hypothetical protein